MGPIIGGINSRAIRPDALALAEQFERTPPEPSPRFVRRFLRPAP